MLPPNATWPLLPDILARIILYDVSRARPAGATSYSLQDAQTRLLVYPNIPWVQVLFPPPAMAPMQFVSGDELTDDEAYTDLNNRPQVLVWMEGTAGKAVTRIDFTGGTATVESDTYSGGDARDAEPAIVSNTEFAFYRVRFPQWYVFRRFQRI